MGKASVIESKVGTARSLLEKSRKTEQFEKLLSQLKSALARRDYATAVNIMAEVQTIAKEIGRESEVKSIPDDLET